MPTKHVLIFCISYIDHTSVQSRYIVGNAAAKIFATNANSPWNPPRCPIRSHFFCRIASFHTTPCACAEPVSEMGKHLRKRLSAERVGWEGGRSRTHLGLGIPDHSQLPQRAPIIFARKMVCDRLLFRCKAHFVELYALWRTSNQRVCKGPWKLFCFFARSHEQTSATTTIATEYWTRQQQTTWNSETVKRWYLTDETVACVCALFAVCRMHC